ncbi:hypothetical protein SPHINGO8AM_80136 [Sphingomonas sp. 8AM]|nr:hypothetical protein SPHINGO8AM_80136 [Sphingomonas sp. 8AM]
MVVMPVVGIALYDSRRRHTHAVLQDRDGVAGEAAQADDRRIAGDVARDRADHVVERLAHSPQPTALEIFLSQNLDARRRFQARQPQPARRLRAFPEAQGITLAGDHHRRVGAILCGGGNGKQKAAQDGSRPKGMSRHSG